MSIRPVRWAVAVAAFALLLLTVPKTSVASTITATVSWQYDWGTFDPSVGEAVPVTYTGTSSLVGTWTWIGSADPNGEAWQATLGGATGVTGVTLEGYGERGGYVFGYGSIPVGNPAGSLDFNGPYPFFSKGRGMGAILASLSRATVVTVFACLA